MYKPCQQALSTQMLNTLGQLTQHFGLICVQLALQAYQQLPHSEKIWPMPIAILRLLADSKKTKALLAWTKVRNAITQIGSNSGVTFDDPIIHTVIDGMGDWVDLCACTRAQLQVKEIEFQKRYQAYLNKPPSAYPTHNYLPDDKITRSGNNTDHATFISDHQKKQSSISQYTSIHSLKNNHETRTSSSEL